jgi:predicted small lipoprotein YifL
MRRSNLLLPLCLVAVTLAGCGQKGPLVMPPAKPAAASTVIKPAQPAIPATVITPANPSNSNVPDGDQN